MNEPRLVPDTATQLALYRGMRRVRVVDERLLALQRQGRIGFHGSCVGQEAVPVGTALALAATDWVFPALRESSVLLVRNFPLDRYLAQAFGNDWDVAKGRQMPSHMSGRDANVVSWSSSIGTQLPHAVGVAWAAKIRGDKTVVVAFLGDGATSTPDFHAALNFAAVFAVPCVFVCQNNHWAISTPVARQTESESLAVKASAYAIPSERIDGNAAPLVYSTVRAAAERARSGAGPTFIECLTYRMGGHSTSDDPTLYRDPAEVALWAERDPITRLGRELTESGALDAESMAKIDAELNAEVQAAIQRVEARPPPPRSTLFDDVYVVLPFNLLEQKAELLRGPTRPSSPPPKP